MGKYGQCGCSQYGGGNGGGVGVVANQNRNSSDEYDSD